MALPTWIRDTLVAAGQDPDRVEAEANRIVESGELHRPEHPGGREPAPPSLLDDLENEAA